MTKMNQLPAKVKKFAAGNESLYVMFQDMWNHYRSQNGEKKFSFDTRISYEQKEEQVNDALQKEIFRVAGLPFAKDAFSTGAIASHPTLRWAAFAVVNQLIDAILPDTMVDSVGAYADVRSIGFGDSASFDITPRDLFVVSKAGRGMRQAEIRRQFNGQVTILPELRELTVGVSLYKVLSGKESLARLAMKAIKSLESQMTVDAYNAFATAMAALPNAAGDTQLRVAGWSQDDFVRLAQKVGAWNGGVKPIVLGTQRALQQVLPDDANYRYSFESDYVKVGYMKNFFGYDAIALPQVADWVTEFAVTLDDAKLWIVSPTEDKLVKLVLEGSTIANTDGMFANADLSQNITLMKSWGTGIATGALAAVIELP